MRFKNFSLFVLIVALAPVAFASTEPLGFKDWKATRVLEAKLALEKAQSELDPNLPAIPTKTQAVSSKPQSRLQKGARVDNRLSQAQTNLEIAQELGAHDYFVLYLSQLKTDIEVQEAAKKLDPSEVAEIMIGIKKQLNTDSEIQALPTVAPTPGQRTSLLGR